MSTEDQNKDGTGDKDFVPPKDGSWVPRSRMNEAVEKVQTPLQQKVDGLIAANARLEEQLKNNPPRQQQQETIYTLPELRKFVEDEKISQAQADDIYEKQNTEAVNAQVDERMKTHLNTSDEKRAAETQLDAYIQILPDLLVSGTEDNKKVLVEYNKLAKTFGMPVKDSVDDTKLSIAACQVAFGDADQLKKVRSRDHTSEERETYQEQGSHGEENVSEDETKIKKSLDKRKRDYYQGMIDKKFYKDWKQVGEELEFAKR